MKTRNIKYESIINPDLWYSLLPKSEITSEINTSKLLDYSITEKTLKKTENENHTFWIEYP